jgi:hypothetical protein
MYGLLTCKQELELPVSTFVHVWRTAPRFCSVVPSAIVAGSSLILAYAKNQPHRRKWNYRIRPTPRSMSAPDAHLCRTKLCA